MYSLLMHRIKIKSPSDFFMEWTKRFVCWFINVQSVLLWRYYNNKKSLPDISGTTYHSRCRLPSSHGTRKASTPWAMSLYFKFRAILYLWLWNEYQWWDQAKIYHIIRQLSHRFMCEIMIGSGDKTKLIHKKTFPQDYELLNLSKTKIPITIVKAQMPSNPNQKSQ